MNTRNLLLHALVFFAAQATNIAHADTVSAQVQNKAGVQAHNFNIPHNSPAAMADSKSMPGGAVPVKPQTSGGGGRGMKSGAFSRPTPISGGSVHVTAPGASPYATGDEDETNDLEVQRRTVSGSTAARNVGAMNGAPTSSGAVSAQHSPADIKIPAAPTAMQAKQSPGGTPTTSFIPVHK